MADDQRVDSTRRELLKKAGWLVPVILAVNIPKNAFAQYGGGVVTN